MSEEDKDEQGKDDKDEREDSMQVHPLVVSDGTHYPRCPGDKSLTHRALIFAACSYGESLIVNPCRGTDCWSTVDALIELGVRVSIDDDRMTVFSYGKNSMLNPRKDIHLRNSGTSASLLTGLLAGVEEITCTFTGDKSLSARSMQRLLECLRGIGAKIVGKDSDNHLPLTIYGGRLSASDHVLSFASAQVKSALLLSAMNTDDGLVSIDMPAGSRTHTEEMLRAQGIYCKWHFIDGRQRLAIESPYELKARTWRIPNDPSSAAFFVITGVLMPRDTTIILQDIIEDKIRLAYVEVARRMGADIQIKAKDGGYMTAVCDLVVNGGKSLRGIVVDNTVSLIDELPILAVLALFASGPSIFRNVGALRNKESDRLAKIVELITVAGGRATVEGDDLHILGEGGRDMDPFTFDAANDHRMVMAAAVCGLFCSDGSKINHSDGVEVSFPYFWGEFSRLTYGSKD